MISTKIEPVTTAPKSLICVIYSPSAVANRSEAEEEAENPIAVPLALSTILL